MIKLLFLSSILFVSYGFKVSGENMLKIATPFKFNEKNIDPAFVRIVQDATLARALYSGLLEYDKNGRIVLGVATNYKINKNEIEFEIGKKVKLSNGDYLGVEDVEFTIKRNLIKNTTTHSKLKGFFCREKEVVEIDKECSGIRTDKEKNKITFILDNEAKIDSFISILTSHDMRIIPRKSVDKDLEIVNRKLVSGPYRLENISKDRETLELAANENHYRFNSKISKKVMLKYVDIPYLEASFKNREIDVIPLFHKMPLDLFEKLSLENNSFRTEGIKNMFLRFTKKGFEKFKPEERLALGNIFKQRYLSEVKMNKLFQRGSTIYPKLSEAYLSEKEIENLQTVIQVAIEKRKKSSKIKIGLANSVYLDLKKSFYNDDNFEIVLLDKPILELNESDMPDAYIESIDSTFTETSNLLVYALRMGLYGYTEKQANEIINNIYNERNPDKKVEIIKKIHEEILLEGRAIPFGHSPYVAISTKNWSLGFSKYFAATNIDEIVKNDNN